MKTLLLFIAFFSFFLPVAPSFAREGDVAPTFFEAVLDPLRMIGSTAKEVFTFTIVYAQDKDADSIGDTIDNCPDAFNIGQEDSNQNGMGDACEDSDGDGLFDADDTCPLIPARKGNRLDTNGCPSPVLPTTLQEKPRELLPQVCAEGAPCRVTLTPIADIRPLLDCLYGVVTNNDATLVYSKGEVECVE